MNAFLAPALVAVSMVVSQLILPGKAEYHAGWYNVLLVALVAVAAIAARRYFAALQTSRARLAAWAVVAGAVICAAAGVASGLFGADTRTYVGAPGQRMRADDLGGSLVFPFAEDAGAEVALERPLHRPIAIGGNARNAGSFILRARPREIVFVEARDARGNRLTITQPTGAVFLSPALLMQQRQTIAGMDLPFDSFAVPAARRIVKAVLLDPQQAAMLSQAAALPGKGAVLFAVDDENDRPLPHAIALSAGGRPAAAAGLILQGTVATYPAVEAVSSPALVAVAAGTLLALAGLAGTLAARRPTLRPPPPERS